MFARYKTILFVLLTVAYLHVAAIAFATNTPMAFRHLGIEQGLSQSSVLSIAQDKLGNIWFGTQDGLNMYDGYDFKIYKADYSNPDALQSGFIGALYTDSEGKLWVGTASGLALFRPVEECFQNYPEVTHGNVNHITAYAGRLALSTDSGLVLFDPVESSGEYISLGFDYVTRCSFALDHILLMATDVGLYVFRDGNALPVNGFTGVDVHAITPSQDGGWWIGVYGDGLYRTDAHFNVIRHYKGEAVLPSDYVRVLHTDTYGRLWVGTYDGLAVYDDMEGAFRVCKHGRSAFSLSHDSVRAIFSDDQNGIWIGTWFGGVNYWNRQDDKLREVSLSSEGVYGFVSCLCQDPTLQRIWIGTNDDGLFLYSLEDGSLYHPNIPLVSGNIKCVVPGSDGNLYIGMHMGGIMRLNPKNLAVRGFAINGRAPIKNGCYSLLELGSGDWLVGSLEGLFLFNIRSGIFLPHPAVASAPELGRRLITVLFKDRASRIWIGTDEGLFRLSPDGSVQAHAELLPAVSAAGFHVNQIQQDSYGRIWVASSRGLLEYTGISDPKLYTKEEGLPDNNIRSVLNGEGGLWLCSGKTICRLHPETRAVTVINRPTGNEFVEGAACEGADGQFYFGGLGGLVRFSPDDMYSNPYSPKPYFFDVNFGSRNDGEVERNDLGACVSASVPYYKGPLVVHWSVLNMLSYGENAFYYRIDGFGDRWHKTTDRQASFANLTPGKYTIQLRSANNEGVMSEGFVNLSLHILPRWWQSRVFHFAIAFMSVLFLVFVVMLLIMLVRTKGKLNTRNAEIHLLEENLDRTRSLITSRVGSDISGEVSADSEFLNRAARVVEANIDNEAFSSEEFARQMFMSRSKLYDRIQKTTNGTVSDFIRKIRFDRACALLLEGRYSVSEISAMVGFSSPSYFATSFKKYKGCLPKEYGKSDVNQLNTT